MKCGQVFDVLETGFHDVMYGNATASAILSLTEWPVPFYDTYNKKWEGRNNQKYCFPIRPAKRRS
jgi:hypothetical protein